MVFIQCCQTYSSVDPYPDPDPTLYYRRFKNVFFLLKNFQTPELIELNIKIVYRMHLFQIYPANLNFGCWIAGRMSDAEGYQLSCYLYFTKQK